MNMLKGKGKRGTKGKCEDGILGERNGNYISRQGRGERWRVEAGRNERKGK